MDPLDTPAFLPQADEVIATPNDSQSQSGLGSLDNNVPVVPSPTDGVVDDEQKVPYSRMKSVIDARRDAERRAEEAEERLNQMLSRNEPARQDSSEPGQYNGALPMYWVRMYGDNENSRYAYTAELERQDAIRDEVRREALDAVREERTQETQVLASHERTIDENLEDLSYSLGRDLSDKEQDAILTIVDEYTPKDDDGNYSGNLIPFEKAWDIYNMQQAQASGTATRQRRVPTMATNTPTEGEPSTKEKDNKEWNPLDWNGWRKRIPN